MAIAAVDPAIVLSAVADPSQTFRLESPWTRLICPATAVWSEKDGVGIVPMARLVGQRAAVADDAVDARIEATAGRRHDVSVPPRTRSPLTMVRSLSGPPTTPAWPKR